MGDEITESTPNENANGALKALGVVLMIVAFITGVASIVRPLQQQISSLQDRINLVEGRTEKQIENLRAKTDDHVKEDTTIRSEIGVKVEYLEKELDRLRNKSN
jgi:predicted PurR-regulated permease PerM